MVEKCTCGGELKHKGKRGSQYEYTCIRCGRAWLSTQYLTDQELRTENNTFEDYV